MRLSLWSLAALALVASTGTAVACAGLSPGDLMTTDAGSCTLAYILASPTDLYFATAGHCIQVDQVAMNPDYGEIGVGAFHFLEPETGSQSDGSPGMDFGLIRIDPALYGDLNPKVCGWDGPKGMYDGSGEGGLTRHYGHGVVFGDLGPTTQQREGYFLFTDEQAFYWTGFAVPGDSGSAVLDENDLALGVFTHVLAGANGVPPADNGGTLLTRGLELAAEGGFTDLRLVLAGEDPVAVMRSMGGAPAEAEERPPTSGPATPTPSPSRPTNSTSAPSNATNGTAPSPPGDDSIVPAAGVEGEPAEPRGTPAPAVPALVLAVVAAALVVRRVRL